MIIAPHGSTKYAVIASGRRYVIVAVHAIDVEHWTLVVSEQFPIGTGQGHGYRAPMEVEANQVLLMAQTSEAAWKYKQQIEADDRLAEQKGTS